MRMKTTPQPAACSGRSRHLLATIVRLLCAAIARARWTRTLLLPADAPRLSAPPLLQRRLHSHDTDAHPIP